MVKPLRIPRPRVSGWPKSLVPSSVKARIIVSFSLVVIILVATAAGSAWLHREHLSDMAKMEEHATTSSLLESARLETTTAALILQHYVITGDETDVSEFRSHVTTAIESLGQARAHIAETDGGDAQMARLEGTLTTVAPLTAGAEEIIALRQGGDVEGAEVVLEETVPTFGQFATEFNEIAEAERQQVAALRSEADRTGDLALWLLVLSGVVGGTLALAVSLATARSILTPLRSLESAALAVSDGDLEARAPTTGPRELARLGASLNRMTESVLDASKRRELEEALRKSEEHFRGLIENASDMISIYDADGTLRFTSPAIERVLGYKPQELIGKGVFDLVHPDDFPRAVDGLAGALRNPGVTHYSEFRFRHKDGSWHTIESAGRVLPDDSGVPTIVVNSRDITERKRAEEALRASEERYRAVFEQAAESIVLIDADTGAMVEFNDSAHETLGYSREEFKRLKIADFEVIESAEDVAKHIERIIREETDSFETKHRTKGGEILDIEVRAKAICVGGRTFLQTTWRDITERKRAEEERRRLNERLEALNRTLETKVQERTQELQESEELYRSLVETSPDSITLTDLDGKVRVCNEKAAQLHGFESAEGLCGHDAFEFIAPEDRQRAVDNLRRTLEMGSIRNIEYTFLTRGGGRFPGEISASVVVDAEGNPKAFIGVVRDISERKRAEEELHLTNEELRERNRQLLDARVQATTDALTGLSNHRAFHEKIREEVLQAETTGSCVGLIMMDIDGFKRVNDSRGHLVGDQILRELALSLTDVAPRQHTYRYGGDEFAVLLSGADSSKTARVAERLRRAAQKRRDGDGNNVTVSLGIASFPDTATSAEELIYGADAAMYWAKSAGKNRVGDWSKLLTYRAGEAMPWYAADRAVKVPDVVAALIAALAAKDPTTAAHTERCSWYAARLARELGLPDEETAVVRLASLLHDIGKLAIPDEVLLKPGQLNEEEWAQMKQHPTAALHVLSHIHSLRDATPAILHHHEHFDGSGYPDGLAGEEIPIASRILLVTDAFDAMTSDRPYRKAMPVEAAIEELKRNSGSQFDPVIVEAFLRVLSREGAVPLGRKRQGQSRAATAVKV